MPDQQERECPTCDGWPPEAICPDCSSPASEGDTVEEALELRCGMCGGDGEDRPERKSACWQCDGTGTVLAWVPSSGPSEAEEEAERVTHGRHCTCSACAREDWTNPELAPCGMHGPSCPRRYDPYGPAGSTIPSSGPSEAEVEAPDVTVEFTTAEDGVWVFEVTAKHDPCKPWASGTAGSFDQAWDSAATYAMHSADDVSAARSIGGKGDEE